MTVREIELRLRVSLRGDLEVSGRFADFGGSGARTGATPVADIDDIRPETVLNGDRAAALGWALLPDPLDREFASCYEEVFSSGDDWLRLVLVIDDTSLDAVPWELAVVGGTELLSRPRLSVVRRVAHSTEAVFTRESVEVFGIDAWQDATVRVESDVPDDPRVPGWSRSVRSTGSGDLTTVENQLAAAAEQSDVIVHVSGHGEADGLLRLGDGSAEHAVPGARLGAILGHARLAVLSTCSSAAPDRTSGDPGPSLARVVAAQVPAVVGMLGRVTSADAAVFSGAFYNGLVKGESLDAAFRAARLELRGGAPNERHAAAMPVLYVGVAGEGRPFPNQGSGVRVAPLALLAVGEQPGRLRVAILNAGRLELHDVEDVELDDEAFAVLSADGRVVAAASDHGLLVRSTYRQGDPIVIPWPDELTAPRLLSIRATRASYLRALVAASGRTWAMTVAGNSVQTTTEVSPFEAQSAVDTIAGAALVVASTLEWIDLGDRASGPDLASVRSVLALDAAEVGGAVIVAVTASRKDRVRIEVHRSETVSGRRVWRQVPYEPSVWLSRPSAVGAVRASPWGRPAADRSLHLLFGAVLDGRLERRGES